MAKRQETENGTVTYRDDDGKYHREDGPAIEYASGFKIYYNHGKKLTKEEFEAKEGSFQSWRQILSWDVSRYTPQLKTVRDLKKLVPELECIGTGGGCEALSKDYPNNNNLLLTDADANAPRDSHRTVMIGFFDHEGSSVIPDFLPGNDLEEKQNYTWRLSIPKAYKLIQLWEAYLKSVNYVIPDDVARV